MRSHGKANRKTQSVDTLTQNIVESCMFMVLREKTSTYNILARTDYQMKEKKHHVHVSMCSTHVKDGDDGWIIPADYGGNILCFGNLGGDQLKVTQKEKKERRGYISQAGRNGRQKGKMR